MEHTFETARAIILEELRSRIENIKNIQFRESFRCEIESEVLTSSEAAINFLKSIPSKEVYIYFFDFNISTTELERTRVFRLFNEYKNRNEKKCSKAVHNNSNTLYVGSSKGLRSRIKGHLGLGPGETFSLHLRNWYSAELPLAVTFLKIETQDQGLLQDIEDGIWMAKAPMFGKRGGK